MKVLFLAAHADDIEVTAPNTVKYFIDAGHEVIMSLATCDEYAWLYAKQEPDFKGARQAQIRINEMNRAARAYGLDIDGKPLLKLHWLGWIDGYVPLSRKALVKLKIYLQDLAPDAIFAPDWFPSSDHHNDYDNIGVLAYLACKSLPKIQRPRMFLWQSWKNNTYFPVTNPGFTFKPVKGHGTQFPPQRLFVKLARVIWWLLATLRRCRSGGMLAESFRAVSFSPDENRSKRIKDKIKKAFFDHLLSGPPREIYLPIPEDLGLKRDNEIIQSNWFNYKYRRL